MLEIEHRIELVHDDVVDEGGRKWIGGVAIVMAVADDQASVVRAHGDEMHAVFECCRLLRFQSLL